MHVNAKEPATVALAVARLYKAYPLVVVVEYVPALAIKVTAGVGHAAVAHVVTLFRVVPVGAVMAGVTTPPLEYAEPVTKTDTVASLVNPVKVAPYKLV